MAGARCPRCPTVATVQPSSTSRQPSSTALAWQGRCWGRPVRAEGPSWLPAPALAWPGRCRCLLGTAAERGRRLQRPTSTRPGAAGAVLVAAEPRPGSPTTAWLRPGTRRGRGLQWWASPSAWRCPQAAVSGRSSGVGERSGRHPTHCGPATVRGGLPARPPGGRAAGLPTRAHAHQGVGPWPRTEVAARHPGTAAASW